MEFSFKMNIGKGQLEFKSNSIKDIHKTAAIYGLLPKQCSCCGSTDVYLNFKNPGGNDYYGIACKDCGAELNLHQKKEGGFFVKRDEKMQVWQSNQQQPQQNNIPQQNANNVNNAFNNPAQQDPYQNDDDIPF